MPNFLISDSILEKESVENLWNFSDLKAGTSITLFKRNNYEIINHGFSLDISFAGRYNICVTISISVIFKVYSSMFFRIGNRLKSVCCFFNLEPLKIKEILYQRRQ